MSLTWPQEWLDRSLEILRATPRDQYQRALETLSGEVGVRVTGDALQKAFKRRGLQPPTSYLSAPMASPPPSAPPSGECCAPAMACTTRPEAPAEPERRTERVLFVPDSHWPFASERAWALMLKAARDFRPDWVVVLGDLLDCFSVSFHPKDPTRRVNLKAEIDSGDKALADLESLGAKRLVYCEGNHERRIQRYLIQHAPAVFEFFKLEEILRLKERGWLYVPYMTSTKVGSVHVSHEFGSFGMNAHRSARAAVNADCAMGHSHRLAIEYRGLADGTATAGAMFGHLLDIDEVDYMHKASAAAWQLGFGVGHILPSGKTVMQAVPIVDWTCVVDGVLYEQPPLPQDN